MEEKRIYCLVPVELAGRLHESLRRHYLDDPAIEVIVENRYRDRRSARERREAEADPPSGVERRTIRNPSGRRVTERRAALVPLSAGDAPELPRRARRHTDELVFVERLVPSTEALEDADTARLVIRFQAGERTVFSELYMRYFDRVWGYLRALLRDPHEAEDLTQQVFISVLEALPAYERRRQPFRAWLFVMVRNAAISHFRKHGRVEVEDPHEARDRPEPVDERPIALGWLTDRDLQVLVERLPPLQRQVLLLRYLLDLSTKEVAEILDRNPAQVRKLQHRALRFLRERMTALGRVPDRRGRPSEWRRRITQVRVLRDRRYALMR